MKIMENNILTVVLWRWKKFNDWSTNYSAQHVNAVCRMLKKHLHMPHRVVLITDTPDEKFECETYPLWDKPVVNTKKGTPNCYKRLYAFSKDMVTILGSRFVSIDLDCLIMPGPDGRGITPLFENDNDFMIMNGWRASHKDDPLGKGCCPYNGSMWLMNTGARDHVWTDFDPETSPQATAHLRMPNGLKWYGSDQCWIAHKCPNEKTFNVTDGVHSFIRDARGKKLSNDCRIIFFPGHVKPWTPAVARLNSQIWNEYRKYL